MRNLAKRIGGVVRCLHDDQRGANMVEYILIIAAIALPLLAVILLYRNEITEWAKQQWDHARSTPDPTTP